MARVRAVRGCHRGPGGPASGDAQCPGRAGHRGRRDGGPRHHGWPRDLGALRGRLRARRGRDAVRHRGPVAGPQHRPSRPAEPGQRPPVRGRADHEPVRRAAPGWRARGIFDPAGARWLGAGVRARGGRPRAHHGVVPGEAGGAPRGHHARDRRGLAVRGRRPAAAHPRHHGRGHEPRQQRGVGGVRALRPRPGSDGPQRCGVRHPHHDARRGQRHRVHRHAPPRGAFRARPGRVGGGRADGSGAGGAGVHLERAAGRGVVPGDRLRGRLLEHHHRLVPPAHHARCAARPDECHIPAVRLGHPAPGRPARGHRGRAVRLARGVRAGGRARGRAGPRPSDRDRRGAPGDRPQGRRERLRGRAGLSRAQPSVAPVAGPIPSTRST